MTAAPGGALPVRPVKTAESRHGSGAEGWQGARLRAAIDRLHAAQLAALAPRGEPVVPAAPAPAPPAPPQQHPAARRDAHDAQREVLARMHEIGSLLVLLARLGREDEADAEAVAIRLQLVQLAVAAAITLAELVGLAFEIESPADRGCCRTGSPVRSERARRLAPNRSQS